jgi:metal-responsive CopG/Arc/MetJ family transcriptional regulator
MDMHRTTILLPEDLQASAEAVARRQGISLGELIRRQLRVVAKSKKAKSRRDDPVFRHHLGHHHENVEDTATDVVLNHDKYIAEALEAEVRRWR